MMGEAPLQGSQAQASDLPSISSWFNVVQAKKVMEKYDLNVLSHDGVNYVMVPNKVFKKSSPLWGDFFYREIPSYFPSCS